MNDLFEKHRRSAEINTAVSQQQKGSLNPS